MLVIMSVEWIMEDLPTAAAAGAFDAEITEYLPVPGSLSPCDISQNEFPFAFEGMNLVEVVPELARGITPALTCVILIRAERAVGFLVRE
jgi:hypothetical protein